MAKRDTGVGSKKQGHPHKTQKRLAIKQEMLVKKTKRHNRKIASLKNNK
jgi:hypothetical protein